MTYADAVLSRSVTEWLCAHAAPPMPEAEPVVWTRAVQLWLWPELEAA